MSATILANRGASIRSSQSNAHAGLLSERFLPMWQWEREDAPPKAASPLLDVLQSFARTFNERGRRGDEARALLQEQHERMQRLPLAIKQADYQVAWRLATGLGAAHPSENGFSFDPLIGVPWLPGSSVKGLVRGGSDMAGATLDQIETLLGPETDSPISATGDLVFLDAYPVAWPSLEVDIVNCHHPAYYAHPDPRGPSETESPVPAYFLVVGKGARFRFRLASRSRNESHVETGMNWLKEGLTTLGIGAKTAVGYGVME